MPLLLHLADELNRSSGVLFLAGLTGHHPADVRPHVRVCAYE